VKIQLAVAEERLSLSERVRDKVQMSVLQCVAVCCSMLQCFSVCLSVSVAEERLVSEFVTRYT